MPISYPPTLLSEVERSAYRRQREAELRNPLDVRKLLASLTTPAVELVELDSTRLRAYEGRP